jgi:signal peptidase I
MTDSWFVILFLLISDFAGVYEARKFRDHAEAFRMAGKPMNPTLFVGDLILTERHPYHASEPIVSEIFVYRSPIQSKQHWTSRVIAAEGQTVEIRKGKLLVEGRRFHHPPRKTEPYPKPSAV